LIYSRKAAILWQGQKGRNSIIVNAFNKWASCPW
jgi:hypothetical protein